MTSTLTVQGNAFSVGGSTFVVVSGSVAIGTLTPQSMLDVEGTAQFGAPPFVASVTANGSIYTSSMGVITSGVINQQNYEGAVVQSTRALAGHNAFTVLQQQATGTGGAGSLFTMFNNGRWIIGPDGLKSTMTVTAQLQISSSVVIGNLVPGSMAINAVIESFFTFDAASIAASTVSFQTANLAATANVAAGDHCVVYPRRVAGDGAWSVQVSSASAGNITMEYINPTAAAQNPPSEVYDFDCTRF
jgi:hypothetical protein